MTTIYEEDRLPIVIVRVIGPSTDEDVSERMRFLDRQLARSRRFVGVFDATGAEPLSAGQRRAWGDWLRARDALLRQRVAACSFVDQTRLMRGVFTGIFWLWSPPMPYAFAKSTIEGVAWARVELGRAKPMRLDA
jgi:hypothetical protein